MDVLELNLKSSVSETTFMLQTLNSPIHRVCVFSGGLDFGFQIIRSRRRPYSAVPVPVSYVSFLLLRHVFLLVLSAAYGDLPLVFFSAIFVHLLIALAYQYHKALRTNRAPH
mmetsp:Transcript_9214/g.14267  ORF Transcript_9214/g.14267 Transcript_9214/m.14267 type:complete len:112 (+) Transcript_9214:231-566(+)